MAAAGWGKAAAMRGKRETVFVYGTLKRGHGNHRVLSGAVFLGEDEIAASMFDLGYFPAVLLGGSGVVRGEVYEVDQPVLARLDHLEGIPALYQRTRVSMTSGRDAWVYVMSHDQLVTCPQIKSGRWEAKR